MTTNLFTIALMKLKQKKNILPKINRAEKALSLIILHIFLMISQNFVPFSTKLNDFFSLHLTCGKRQCNIYLIQTPPQT